MLADVDTRVLSNAAVADVPPARRIVVGFDGSPEAYVALEWAARESIARSSAVVVVACPTMPAGVDADGRGVVQRARLIAAVHEVRRRHHGLRVEAADAHTDPTQALVLEAVGAELLVVGASAPGSTRRWLSGSGPRVARRRSCPVVVVHGSGREQVRRVVVGVDSSNAAAAALDCATAEADLRGADLMVVQAWERPVGDVRSMRSGDLRRADAACALDIAVRACEQRTLQPVEGMLREGDAAQILVAVATGTDLLVVGSRGRSGYATMLFGSVATSVVDHAECPTVVVHPHLRRAV